MDSETPPDDDAGPLAALAVERVTDAVEAMHAAIVAPWLRPAGSVPGVEAGWRATTAVYAAVRTLGAATAEAAAQGSATLGRLVPVGNALWGDELHRRRTEAGTEEVLILQLPPAENQPERAPKKRVVLLHGLGETESVWHEAGIVSQLVEAGHPVVLVRYNTGRSVADTGLELAETIQRAGLDDEPITLVGFSMGGLVACAALDAARQVGLAWAKAVEHPSIITIGAPHLGSPIEKGVEWASQALSVSPYSRPIADFVERRSEGIQDLRHGMSDPASEVATIAGTVADNPAGLFGRLFGDLVVRPASATAVGDKAVVLGGVHHSGLLGDERVHSQLLKWLAE